MDIMDISGHYQYLFYNSDQWDTKSKPCHQYFCWQHPACLGHNREVCSLRHNITAGSPAWSLMTTQSSTLPSKKQQQHTTSLGVRLRHFEDDVIRSRKMRRLVTLRFLTRPTVRSGRQAGPIIRGSDTAWAATHDPFRSNGASSQDRSAQQR